MNFRQIAVLLATGLFAAAALSGEQAHHKVGIVVVDSDDNSETRIELDNDNLEFRLHDMEVGQNQSVVDKEGRAVLITRVEDGFTFDIEGKTIRMSAFGDHGGENVWMKKAHAMSDFDVRVMHDGMSGQAMDMDGVMIISGAEIDAATQQLIRSTLESAGHSSVTFVGGDDGGQHNVRVIKKVVHRTE